MAKWIIENGIKVYKNHFCHCPCHGRIPYPKSSASKSNHEKRGIPKYIRGHWNRGKKFSKEHRENMSKAQTGKHLSEETCLKLSKAHSGENNYWFGKTLSEEHIEKLRAVKLGKKMSKDTCEKMRIARLGEKNPNFVDGYGQERGNSKFRGRGFFPLNKKTKIADTQHHIDEDIVIFIPREMHEKNWHNLKTGEGMDKINALAFEFYTIQWCEEHDIEY